jgi:hypothetical protein
VEFVIRSPDLKLEMLSQRGDSLAAVNAATSLCEVVTGLSGDKKLDFYWLNLLIGVRLERGSAATGAWNAEALWHNAMKPWDPWV